MLQTFIGIPNRLSRCIVILPVNAYGATKAAIMEHSRYLAAALAKDGIR